MDAKTTRPWWKQRWPWLLMSGPAAAMIGCAITIWLAYQTPDVPIQTSTASRVSKSLRP
ncbi:MAG: putative CcoH-like protein [Pseudomonadota bacterium]|jgi:hypothetical protein